MSCIQISNMVCVLLGVLVKPFIAVLMLYSAVVLCSALESALYRVGMDVHGPCYGWSMRQALAMLLVPDTKLMLLLAESEHSKFYT